MVRGSSGMPPGVRPLTVGDPVVFGRYLLLGRLGTGGMGVVYLAEHPRDGLVALKTPHAMHLNDATLRARFAEEVRFSRRIVPFCTAAVIEDGVDGDRPYLVTEYIPGPALSQVVGARGALTPDLAYGVALGVAAALVAVHDAGLVHRDLKPGNVLLSAHGPRVIDFGIARDVDTLAAHTQAGQVMGSPGWVAPERLTGGPAMPASDVFAWGCLVAYAAAGHHPFGGGEDDVLTRRIMFEPPRVEAVPALLRTAVELTLAKDPAVRPRAADLLRALLAAGGVGTPWDLRGAVGGVLAEIWTPVPYPPDPGRTRRAPSPGGHPGEAGRSGRSGDFQDAWHPWAPGLSAGSAASAGGEGSVACGGSIGFEGPVGFEGPAAPALGRAATGRRNRAKAGAHLSRASFAALATVSIAAITVIAASGDDGLRADGGLRTPVIPPAVQLYGTAGSTLRPQVTPVAAEPGTPAPGTPVPVTVPPAGVPTSTRSPASAPVRRGTPTAAVARIRTRPPSTTLQQSPDRQRARLPTVTRRPRRPGQPDPRDCPPPAAGRRGPGGACPKPSASVSVIPQDGPGESTESDPPTVPAPAPTDPSATPPG